MNCDNDIFIAIDIGASSGRHIAGCMKDGKMIYEEVYRFPNGCIEKNGHKCWDIDALKENVINGLKKCGEIYKTPISIGIDTWGVDFVLLDENMNMLGDAVAYRDDRTKESLNQVYHIIKEDELYHRTGIQKQPFNTIYQLMWVKNNTDYMKRAKHFLMIPDYLNYILTGVITNEYTNATTTQLVNPITKDFDYELIERLGYNKDIFSKPVMPGMVIGKLRKEIEEKIGFNCNVIAPATHDTGSAVASIIPDNNEKYIYISSGTWSLMGVETEEYHGDEKSRLHNFTNEGGIGGKIRYLKNIMGLWMIQQVKKEENDRYSFEELCKMAEDADIDTIVDCNSEMFLAPESMKEAINKYCTDNNLKGPHNTGETAKVIYNSLAKCYESTLKEIEEMTGICYDSIYIVGGGVKAGYLNRLTEKYTGKKVKEGPSEATALGNLRVQYMARHNK